MLKKQIILRKIEEARELMQNLMKEKEKLTDPELVELSQELDKLLNQYDKLKNNSQKL